VDKNKDIKESNHFLITSIVGFIFALILCEFILNVFNLPKSKNLYYRFFNPELHSENFIFDNDLFWKAKPNKIIYGVKVNNKGFRGENFAQEKNSDTVRIIFLGDSCTFQAEVEDKKTVAGILKDRFKENFPWKKIQIYNMGIPGYSSLQGLRLLEKEVLNYFPNILLVNFGHNDVVPAIFLNDKHQKANGPRYVMDKILSKIRCYRLLCDIYLKIFLLSEIKNYKFLPRVDLQDYDENISKICKIAKENNIKIILYNLPLLINYNKWNKEYCAFRLSYFEHLKDIAKDNNVCFVNVRSAFASLKEVDSYFNNPEQDMIHFNDKGYQLMADTLYPFIVKALSEIDSFSNN